MTTTTRSKTAPAYAPTDIQYEEGRFMLAPQLAAEVEIFRCEKGGYQRPLDTKRVAEIAADLRKAGESNYPEVTLANINGKLQCVDGQHRLLAHVAAGIACPVHVMPMTQNEANDLFIRDNGKARALRRADLVAGSRHKIAQDIRKMAKAFNLSQIQVTHAVLGIMRRSKLPLFEHEAELDEREKHALTVALYAWSKNEKCVGTTLTDMRYQRAARIKLKDFANSIERSFSSPTMFWILGRLCNENIANLNRLKSDINILADADWKVKNMGSLRTMATGTSTAVQYKLWDYIQGKILLPAYKGR